MAYEMVMPYHLHMPSYFLETFTEYPELFFRRVMYVAYSCFFSDLCRIHFLSFSKEILVFP